MVEGQVYRDFDSAVVDALPEGLEYTKWLGGIDFGTRNPFAAVWGFFDPSGIFWLAELHERGKAAVGLFRPPARPGIVAGGEDLRATADKRCRCAREMVAGMHRLHLARKASLQKKPRVLQTWFST